MSRYNHVESPCSATLAVLLLLGLTAAGFLGGPTRASAQSNDPGMVIATTPVSDPRLVAVNPQTNRIYVIDVAFPTTTSLEVFDGVTHTCMPPTTEATLAFSG